MPPITTTIRTPLRVGAALAADVDRMIVFLSANPGATFRQATAAIGISNKNVFAEARARLNLGTEARFWSKVNKNGPTQPHMTTPCWEWTGSKTTNGYGQFNYKGRQVQAHRVPLLMGMDRELRSDEWACHHCDNRICVNPSHIFIGTRQDNVDDMLAKGRNYVARGEAQPKAKLRNEDVLEIRRLLPTRSVRSISIQFGVSRMVIAGIRDGKLWRHV